MRICVTKKDIAKARLALGPGGIGVRSRCCPVAQSFKRRGLVNCLVSITTFYLGGESTAHQLPPTAIKFIEAFDNGRRVSPITFTIEKAAVEKC